MRKIISKPEGNRKKRAKQIILGIILVAVITLSTIGYSFDMSERKSSEKESSDRMVYNGLEFIREDNFWTVVIENQKFYFSYNPNEAETGNNGEITKTLTDYSSKPLYVHSESPEAEYEIYRNLDRFILRRQYACLNSTEKCEKDYPVKTCSDNFIIIEERKSGNNEIRQEQNCVFISGNREELVKLTDELVFKILGIE